MLTSRSFYVCDAAAFCKQHTVVRLCLTDEPHGTQCGTLVLLKSRGVLGFGRGSRSAVSTGKHTSCSLLAFFGVP